MASLALSRLRLALPAFAAATAGFAAYDHFAATAPFCASADADAKLALDPSAWTALKLREKAKLTPNTWRLKFELPPGTSAALPVASCLVTKAVLPGDAKPTIRPYTPVSAPDDTTLDLVVKGYPTGKLSKHIVDLPVGASLDFKGPIPKYDLSAPNKHSHIGMVAGGSGLTPMLQVAEALLGRAGETTKLSLIFANQSEADIILKDELDGLVKAHPGKFSVYYVVDKPKWGGAFWKGGVGYVTKEMVAEHMPAPSEAGGVVFVCGPPPMMKALSGDKAPDKSQGELTGLLKTMGYAPSQVFKF